MKKSGILDQWSYGVSLPASDVVTMRPGAELAGLVLYNISHQAHALASDMRVASIWINDGAQGEKELKLGVDDFEIIRDYKRIRSDSFDDERYKPPYQFSSYPVVEWAQVVYLSRDPIVFEGSKLKVTQTYILTDYASSPAHEPGGLLTAARLFPNLTFELVNVEGQQPNNAALVTIRVDYRMSLKLDVFLDSSQFPKGGLSYFRRLLNNMEIDQLKRSPQQAGLFRDIEGFPTTPTGVFAAVEKPVVAEVIATGLRKGAPGTWPPQGSTAVLPGFPFFGPIRDTWDNTHWWGGYKDYHMPSAPGAFHAAHLHWRWGFLQQTEALPVGEMGAEQFKGTYIGGPLVDPLIPDQDIWAVILRQGTVNRLQADFKAQIKALRTAPDLIADGSDIELWLVCRAHVNDGAIRSKGTFCIHGLFFAHDAEPEYWTDFAGRFQTGTRKREYIPEEPDEKAWERNPKP